MVDVIHAWIGSATAIRRVNELTVEAVWLYMQSCAACSRCEVDELQNNDDAQRCSRPRSRLRRRRHGDSGSSYCSQHTAAPDDDPRNSAAVTDFYTRHPHPRSVATTTFVSCRHHQRTSASSCSVLPPDVL